MDGPIENPGGAFQESLEYPLDLLASTISQCPQPTYKTVYNSGSTAIKQGQVVRVDVTGTTTHVFGATLCKHGDTIAQAFGVAAEAIAVGAIGRVVVDGPCAAMAGAAGVTAGNQLSPSTVSTDDGELVVSSSPAVGQVLGYALTTQATGGSLFAMWVMKF